MSKSTQDLVAQTTLDTGGANVVRVTLGPAHSDVTQVTLGLGGDNAAWVTADLVWLESHIAWDSRT